MDYEMLKLKEFKYWTLYLHPNQAYLGRTYLVSKRDGDLDLTDMSDKEAKEFLKIILKVKTAVFKAFGADRMNFSQFGNDWHNLHVHIIPRYTNSPERTFCGVRFIDIRPNGNYAPYNRDFTVPSSALTRIKRSIVQNLNK